MFLIGLTSAAQGLKLKNGGGMKIRIAKKELKKIISEAYRIDKRRVKLTRTYFAFKSGYGYRYRDDSIGFYSIRIRAKNKPIIVTKISLLRLMKEMFKAESSFAAVKANWDKAVAPIMRCGGGNIDCNKDSNCVLAGDIICRKLADIEMYEEACKYAADLNMDIVEKYMEA